MAAVLPLLRRRKWQLSATGLLLGSMAPDFEKFMRMSLHNGHSHTWGSIFYFSVPVALGLAFVFHLVVRDALLAHLPPPLYQRLATTHRLGWPAYFRRRYVRVLLSVVLGAASHILWDALTHRRPYLASYLPELLVRLPLPLHPPLFKVLELLSSVGGLAALAFFVWRLPRTTTAYNSPAAVRRYWRLVGTTAGLLLLVRVLPVASSLHFWDVVVSALSTLMLGVVVASVYYPSRATVPAGAKVLS